jgi:hypothetical protein
MLAGLWLRTFLFNLKIGEHTSHLLARIIVTGITKLYVAYVSF